MAKIETITFAQPEDEIARVPENYTQVTGIYTQHQMVPQFLNGPDNVQQSASEMLRAEQVYLEQQDLRFFRIR
jgi:hypothetical protein